jgi:hypothetical protein
MDQETRSNTGTTRGNPKYIGDNVINTCERTRHRPNRSNISDTDYRVGSFDSTTQSDQSASRDSRASQPQNSRVVTGNKSHGISRIPNEYISVTEITNRNYAGITHSCRYCSHINSKGGGRERETAERIQHYGTGKVHSRTTSRNHQKGKNKSR